MMNFGQETLLQGQAKANHLQMVIDVLDKDYEDKNLSDKRRLDRYSYEFESDLVKNDLIIWKISRNIADQKMIPILFTSKSQSICS